MPDSFLSRSSNIRFRPTTLPMHTPGEIGLTCNRDVIERIPTSIHLQALPLHLNRRSMNTTVSAVPLSNSPPANSNASNARNASSGFEIEVRENKLHIKMPADQSSIAPEQLA